MRNRRALVATVALMATSVAAPALAATPGEVPAFPWASWAVGIVNLIIFLGIIIKFGGPGINNHFANRRRSFLSNLEEASRLRKEAEARLEEYNTRLEQLELERQRILDEYHAQGEREKQRLVEAAKKQVEKMRADAEVTIEQETKKAVAELEQQAVDLAVGMARNLAQQRIDAQNQNRLVESYVAEIQNQRVAS